MHGRDDTSLSGTEDLAILGLEVPRKRSDHIFAQVDRLDNPHLQWSGSSSTISVSVQNTSAKVFDHVTATEKALPERPRSLREGWRSVIAWNCLANLIALIANLALLAWGCRRPFSDRGTHVLWSGNVEQQKTVEIASHIAINLISSIILAGSNYTSQVLLAPSRNDVDDAHKANRSLDIGISSSRNWGYLCWRRKGICFVLLILMLPIHLFYNSIIFSTSIAFDTSTVAFVTEDFMTASPNGSAWNYSKSFQSGQEWTQITYKECREYLQLDYNLYSNMLVVTNVSSRLQNSNSFSIVADTGCNWDSPGSYLWMFPTATGYASLSNDILPISSNGSDYVTMNISASAVPLWQCQANDNGTYEIGNTQAGAEIQYCFIQTMSDSATVELIPQLLIVVVVCNVLKIFVLSWVVFSNFNPLLTTGDAIASFLDDPDHTTQHTGPISTQELLSAEFKSRDRNVPLESLTKYTKPWKTSRKRYFHGVKTMRWKFTIAGCLFCIFLLIGGLVPFSSKISGSISISSIGSRASANTVIPYSSPVSSALLANSPQLALAAMYMAFNSVWTNMLLSKELVSFSEWKHQSLRVTRPEGEQRDTLFLSLPLRYFVPLFLLGLASHWVLSQTVFIVYIRLMQTDGVFLPSADIRGAGYFPGGVVILVCLLILLDVITFCFGMRRYRSAVPIIGSNSLCLSAACHPFDHAGERESIKKLRYGVIREPLTGETRVGFTSGEVRCLVVGEIYGTLESDIDEQK